MRKSLMPAILILASAMFCTSVFAGPATEPATAPVDRPQTTTVSGQVLGPDGKGIEGVEISLVTDTPITVVDVTTDAEGKFTAELARPMARFGQIRLPLPLVFKEFQGDVAVGLSGSFWWVNPQRKAAASFKLLLQEPDKLVSGTVRDIQGKPVEGVTVCLASYPYVPYSRAALESIFRLGTTAGEVYYTAVSDKDGKYQAKVPYPSVRIVKARGPAGAMLHLAGPSRHIVMLPTQVARLDVTVNTGGAVEASVVDEAGKPVKGATVEVIRAFEQALSPIWISARTDEKGKARLEGVPADAVIVSATPPPDSPFLRAPVVSAHIRVQRGGWATATLTLKPAGVLTGRIVYDNGKPVEGATVSIGHERRKTAADGTYRVGGLVATTQQVYVAPHAPGYEVVDQPRAVLFDASGRASADFVLKPLAHGSLGGKVLDPEGNPVAGARITLSAETGQTRSTTSDIKGEYRFDNIPAAAYEVSAEGPAGSPLKWASGNPRASVRPAERAKHDIRLHRSYEVTVQFVDEQGKPVDRLITQFGYPVRPQSGNRLNGINPPPTTPDGKVTFQIGVSPKLTTDQKFWIGIWLPEHADLRPWPDVIEVVPGKWSVEQRVVVGRGLSIKGTVVDADDKPVAMAAVQANLIKSPTTLPVPSYPAEAVTDADGRFELVGLRDGEYSVGIASHLSNTEKVQVGPGGAADVKLKLLPLGSIKGFVVGRDGKRLPAAVVVSYTMDQPRVPYFMPTATDALPAIDQPFEARDLVAGNYMLRVIPFDNPAGEYFAPVQVALERGQSLVVDLKANGPSTRPAR